MENLECNLVIVAGGGPLRDSLHALMAALPQVNVICETDDIAEALHIISQHSTDLALVGDDIPADELWVFLRMIRKRSPRTLRLIFADTVGRKTEMEAPGAEAVFLRGTTPIELVAEIERMLAVRGAASRPLKDTGDGGARTGDQDDTAFQTLHG
jgi:DNA-binding NarL/FixJ family response regulator